MKFLPLLLGTLSLLWAPQEPLPDGVDRIEEAQLGATRNVHRAGSLWLAGQFAAADLAALEAAGIRKVLTLRTAGELDWDERAAVEEQGLVYQELPFRAPETLTDEEILMGIQAEWQTICEQVYSAHEEKSWAHLPKEERKIHL